MENSKLEKPNLFSLEAEQTVLGTIILNNDYLGKVSDILKFEDFYEVAHQKIYEHIIKTTFRSNLVADSITLKLFFDSEEIIKNIGGGEYLQILLRMGSGIIDIVNYSNLIKDLALKRKLVLIGNDIINEAHNKNSTESATKLIEIAEEKLFRLNVLNETKNGFLNIANSLASTVNKIRLAKEREASISGVPTDYYDLDDLLGGFQDGDLIILAGRPSMGKSALAINFAYNAGKFFKKEFEKGNSEIETQKSVGFFSLEMPADQIASRILSKETKISTQKFRNGEIKQNDFDKIVDISNEISKIPLYIDDTPALSISTLRNRVRRMVLQKNLGIIFVDYLQLIRGTSKQADSSRVLEIGEITMGLKAIAKEFNIPVIALSQLSRSVEQREDKKPLLSDLRESGSIEQDSDIVMFIYREDYYEERRKPADNDEKLDAWMRKMEAVRNRTEIIIAKNRNGPINTVKLRFNSELGEFKDDGGNYEVNE